MDPLRAADDTGAVGLKQLKVVTQLPEWRSAVSSLLLLLMHGPDIPARHQEVAAVSQHKYHCMDTSGTSQSVPGIIIERSGVLQVCLTLNATGH